MSSVGDGGGATRGELRLRVLWSLPQGHQRYLFAEIRKLCREYLRNRRVPAAELTPEELLSEIWRKLLGTVSLDNDEAPGANPADINLEAPEDDGRVVWLLQEIGGSEAIAHRHEDILRQRFGRSLPEGGRPIVQPGNGDDFANISEPDECRPLDEVDAYRVWRGLLAMADSIFQQDDDVSILLRLMADDPEILDEGGRWPIKEMVALLNKRFPPPLWSADRVENAKKRLINWIDRLMRKYGLDATDLEALFARVARQQEGERVLLTETRHPNLRR
jgi:hypothetical protein